MERNVQRVARRVHDLDHDIRVIRLPAPGGGGINYALFICGFTNLGSGRLLMRDGALNDHGKWFTWDSVIIRADGADSFVTVRYEVGVGGAYMDPSPSELMPNDATFQYFPLYHFQYGELKGIYHLGALP